MADWKNPGLFGKLKTLTGDDTSNNDATTTNVAANADGSMLERLEDIKANGTTAVTDALYGTAGIATFPAAAIPANAVSLAEVIRQLYAALEGTAASQNGVATWPTAAAYGNNVSIAEVLGYIQDAVRNGTGTALATNESLADVLYAANGIVTFPNAAIPANGVSLAEVVRQLYAAIEGTAAGQNGVATWPSAAAPANNVSLAEVMREQYDQMEKSISTAAAVLANGDTTIFTIAGGPIEVMELCSVCVTANDGTASTLKYVADPTDGAATDVCAASASLASAAAGNTLLCTGTFASAATLTTNGTVAAGTTKFLVPVGIIKITVATGPSTGTWTHHLRYKPLSRGVTVS